LASITGTVIELGLAVHIGLAFDGTLDSIISDSDFNKANTRDIQADERYILWNMKHVHHADNLLLKENGRGVK
jgi:hypothetical protein